jgi:hypothetical protein
MKFDFEKMKEDQNKAMKGFAAIGVAVAIFNILLALGFIAGVCLLVKWIFL